MPPMQERKPLERCVDPAERAVSQQRLPEIPAWKAFVVQFNGATQATDE